MIGVSQTFVSRLLKIEPGEFILVGFPKQFCTEALSPLDSGCGVDVMRVLPDQQPRVDDVDEINKELCSDHSECSRDQQVYSPMEGRHWTRLGARHAGTSFAGHASAGKLLAVIGCWWRLTSLARTDLQPRQ